MKRFAVRAEKLSSGIIRFHSVKTAGLGPKTGPEQQLCPPSPPGPLFLFPKADACVQAGTCGGALWVYMRWACGVQWSEQTHVGKFFP